jgi:DNA polymerase
MSVHPLLAPRAVLDFETYSEVSVKDVGAWAYAYHPSTEILLFSCRMPDNRMLRWVPGQKFPQKLIDFIEGGGTIEAHNVGFEYAMWFVHLHLRLGIVMPRRWTDTLAVCAYRSLPLGLDKVGEVLDLPVKKDKIGKQLINKLSKPRKPLKKEIKECTLADGTIDEERLAHYRRNYDFELFEQFHEYCDDDVRSEHCLSETIGDLPLAEYEVWVMDQQINNRGIQIDREAVLASLEIVDKITEELTSELCALTSGEVETASQVKRMVEWFESEGVPIPNLQAGTVEEFIKKGKKRKGLIPPHCMRALEIRKTLSKASNAKLIKFRDCMCPDGRVRGLLQYHGAGTGRWSGRLVQPQNFPRGFKADMDVLIDTIKTRNIGLIEVLFGDPLEAISSALRGMFIAKENHVFAVADFAAIEARVVMWLADQDDALEAFYKYDAGEGEDIYCVMASKLYKRNITKKDKDERQLGKITILGCGYQMSGPRLREQAEDSYGVVLDEERANFLVSTYRNEYSCVVDLWRGLEDAAIDAVKNKKSTQYGRIGFKYVEDNAGKWMAMVLPNGRHLWYYNPFVREAEVKYKDKVTGEPKTFTKDQLSYEGRNNKKGGAWTVVSTYGGMLTENAVQAIARDLMVAAMKRVKKAGYEVVLTVHDELVAEVHEDVVNMKEFERLVAGPNPKWAEGCPVEAEGAAVKRYQKV